MHDGREWNPSRRLEMRVGNRQTAARFYEISLKDQASGKETRSAGLVGPTLVVAQGQKTEIVINNALREPTSIHWLGIELESYYDACRVWAGLATRRPRRWSREKSFAVKMIPQRAGSFMYHTHWHDEVQLTGGVHGAMIALPPGQPCDPATAGS